MSATRKFTIWSPAAKLAGTPDLVISQSLDELVTYEDLGQLRYQELTESGELTLQENAAEARLYTFQVADSIEKIALLNYLRVLQKRGDSSASIAVQRGELRYRDEWYRFDSAEIASVNFRVATGTPITVSTRSLTYYEAPCYLLVDGPWRQRLGASYQGTEETSGETADFAILERINPIDSDGITAQQKGTVRVAYGGFQIDFLALPNSFERLPSQSPVLSFSLRDNPSVDGIRQGTYKQRWPIQGAELTERQADRLDAMLSLWRSNWTSGGATIQLTDLTRRIAEPSPNTRTVATGTTAITENGTTQYFATFDVAPDGPLSITRKDGDSSTRLVNIAFGEL